ncbi:hypothetical protein CYMTET_36671, partial [Cymbomonas tetramitiformis]
MKDVDLWLVELAVEDILLMQEMHLRSKWHYIETFVRHLLQQPGEPAVLFVYLGQKSSLTTPAFIPNGTFVADDLWWREHMMDPTMLNAQGLYELVSTYYGIPSFSWVEFAKTSNVDRFLGENPRLELGYWYEDAP